MGIRSEARGTMAQGRKTIAKADRLLDTMGQLLEIGKAILQRMDRISEALEKNGADINPKIGDTEIPIGVNISTTKGA